jgi:hypothetical protein
VRCGVVEWCGVTCVFWVYGCYARCFSHSVSPAQRGLMCRLLAIAEETLTEFLAKATGTAVDWIQLPGMKVRDVSWMGLRLGHVRAGMGDAHDRNLVNEGMVLRLMSLRMYGCVTGGWNVCVAKWCWNGG